MHLLFQVCIYCLQSDTSIIFNYYQQNDRALGPYQLTQLWLSTSPRHSETSFRISVFESIAGFCLKRRQTLCKRIVVAWRVNWETHHPDCDFSVGNTTQILRPLSLLRIGKWNEQGWTDLNVETQMHVLLNCERSRWPHFLWFGGKLRDEAGQIKRESVYDVKDCKVMMKLLPMPAFCH